MLSDILCMAHAANLGSVFGTVWHFILVWFFYFFHKYKTSYKTYNLNNLIRLANISKNLTSRSIFLFTFVWCFLSLGYLATNLFGVQEKVLARKITPLNATKSVLVTNTATKSVHFTHSATKSVHNITDSVIKSVHITDSATKSVHNTKKRARATKSFIYATGLQKFKFCFVLIFIMNNMNIVKFVQGSFNQSHNQFGESAGKQCSCMALTACCWTSVRKTSVWKSTDLNFIL